MYITEYGIKVRWGECVGIKLFYVVMSNIGRQVGISFSMFNG